METGKAVLTVLFEDPFWIGVYEREWDGRYEVCKITFGAEPKDYEVYDFLLKNWKHLPFSPPVKAAPMAEHAVNPKRLQREIRRATRPAGVGAKARHALKLQQEQRKAERTERGREQRDAEKDRQYAILRQEKRRQKHRGH